MTDQSKGRAAASAARTLLRALYYWANSPFTTLVVTFSSHRFQQASVQAPYPASVSGDCDCIAACSSRATDTRRDRRRGRRRKPCSRVHALCGLGLAPGCQSRHAF